MAPTRTTHRGAAESSAGITRASNAGGDTPLIFAVESGRPDVVLFVTDIYEKHGQTVFGGSVLVITGVAERRGAGTLLLASEVREA